MATFYTPDALGQVEISGDGGTTWFGLRNITDFSFSGGDRTETTTQTIDGDPVVSVGKAQPKDVSISVNANPASRAYNLLFDGYKDEKNVQIRVRTNANQEEDNTNTSKTIAIATTGAVTGVQTQFLTNPVFQINRGLVLSNVMYVIESVTSATEMSVSRPDGMNITQVAASSDWEVWRFGVQWVFEAQVLSAGNITLSAGGNPLTESLTIKSTGVLPKPTFIFTTP